MKYKSYYECCKKNGTFKQSMMFNQNHLPRFGIMCGTYRGQSFLHILFYTNKKRKRNVRLPLWRKFFNIFCTAFKKPVTKQPLLKQGGMRMK